MVSRIADASGKPNVYAAEMRASVCDSLGVTGRSREAGPAAREQSRDPMFSNVSLLHQTQAAMDCPHVSVMLPGRRKRLFGSLGESCCVSRSLWHRWQACIPGFLGHTHALDGERRSARRLL